MPLPILPTKYYLSHFFEMIDVLEAHYQPVLAEEHRQFLENFRSLSENAQCMYVRMLNRKGIVFSRDEFKKYTEIDEQENAVAELVQKGFASSPSEGDQNAIVGYLKKNDLRKWMALCGFATKASISKEDLVACARSTSLLLAEAPGAEGLLVQGRREELQYLLFLYFGNIQKSLTLYALRDLGVRQASNFKNQFKPRFTNFDLAQNEYFFSQSFEELNQWDDVEGFQSLFRKVQTQTPKTAAAHRLRDQILLTLAERVEGENLDLAMEAWGLAKAHPARERQARTLYKLEKKDECRELLECIIENPWCDEETLFAEDFFARKYGKKKVGYLTQLLQQAEQITLSDFFLKRPEEGVQDYFQKLGYTTSFAENYLWNSLFGVLFWDELFESEQATIFNPFERAPQDLVHAQFYEIHCDAIERKLAMLKEDIAPIHLLKTVTEQYGRLNDIFQWHESLAETLVHFVRSAKTKDVGRVMRVMAQNFATNHSGFPDLMIEKEGEVRFIEVKAEGDSLRSKQLSKVHLLREAGFQVDVLKVRWQSDPNQIYVVVDVETTGGTAKFHRVTEIGAVKIQNGKVIDEFQTLINPGRPIPQNITRITGITNKMVSGAPKFSEIAEKFTAFTEGAIFVAHNARFDYSFIQCEFQRLDQAFVRPLLCTVSGMRKAYPGLSSYSLKNLTEHFKISLDQHHRALCDAQAAARLLVLMNGRRGEKDVEAS